MPVIIDAKGAQVDVKLSPQMWLAAAEEKISFAQYVNREFPTAPDSKASTFEQLCASSGLVLAPNNEFGFKSPLLGAVLSGRAELNAAAVADANPASRILYPAVIMELIESKLAVDRATDPNAFDQMIGLETSVQSARIEQPVINLTKAEGARAKSVAQLAKPDHMLTITTSDVSRQVPSFGLGLLVSEQALQATTLDFVSKAIQRQAEVERHSRTYEYLLAMLQGDTDEGTSALAQTKVDTLDSSITGTDTLSELALVTYLITNRAKRNISHIVTNVDGYFAIKNVLTTTNTGVMVPGSITPAFQVANVMLAPFKIFICEPSAGWPASTLMGLDSRYAMHRIRNTAASYKAIEEFVLRRATELRFDFSELVVRYFEDAFDVLSLTQT